MKLRNQFSMFAWVTLLLANISPAADKNGAGYYRFPALHGDSLVFTAEGDLWRVSADGGLARRLTSHAEVESKAEISPDGKRVAFAASYEGPVEIYTMSMEGGLPRRVTWEGSSGSEKPYPVSWKSNSELLYGTQFFARRDAFQVAVAHLESGRQEVLPLEQASDGEFDSSGETFYFTRLPRQSSNAKRYTGGLIENLWKFKRGDDEAIPLTADYEGTSRSPMLWRDRLYFCTDRDGSMNLWSIPLKPMPLSSHGEEDEHENDGGLIQHTNFKGFDVLSPCLNEGRIAFQKGADIWIYDIEKKKSRKLQIRLSSDFDQQRTRWLRSPLNFMDDYAISHDGSHVAVTVRGRAFVAPTDPGRLIHLPQPANTRIRDIDFLPQSDRVYYLSDRTGETEFWSQPTKGIAGKARQLTDDATVLRFNGTPSPDGKQVAYTDRDQVLWLLNVKSGKSKKVTASQDGTSFDYPEVGWSPDSRWIAYADAKANSIQRLYLFDTKSDGQLNQPIAVTTDRLDSYSPAFSADGKWIYFLSDRTFRSVQRSPWGPRQPEAYLDKTTSIFALDLVGGQRSPFDPDNELTRESKQKDDSKAKQKREEKNASDEDSKQRESGSARNNTDDTEEEQKESGPEYRLEDLAGRLHRLPIEAGNYSDLQVAKKHVYFVERPLGFDSRRSLKAIPISREPDQQESVTIVTNLNGYRLSSERNKILLRRGADLFDFSADGKKPNLDDAEVDLSDIEVEVRPAQEWRQMFVDAWRLHRDYFYDPEMHGVDWVRVRKRHEKLLPRISDRQELDDLIAMMVGELSAMHTNVRTGDVRDGVEGATFGYLGAILQRSKKRGGYRIQKIYQNDPDYPDDLAPLARAGIDLQAGDVIKAIDGRPTLSVPDARELLLNKSGQQVLLLVKRKGKPGTKQYIVRPLNRSQFNDLKLSDWEYTRRLQTEELGNSQIGYFHMRAMGSGNFSEFVKGFYPVFNRQGLIIDMRQNYGGNIDSWILGRLIRKAWMYWQGRTGLPYSNMHYAFNGHMVVLIDGYTISDGEAFSEGFRRLELGPLIGTKTWGGGVWLRSDNELADGGIARSPEFGVFSPDRVWLIEGNGVSPDIEVDNLPHATFNGKDAQLEAAIEYLKKKIAEDPRELPEAPAYPNKSGTKVRAPE
ncbi:MAG: S41 family peptidase [Planctomycetota bacterium]